MAKHKMEAVPLNDEAQKVARKREIDLEYSSLAAQYGHKRVQRELLGDQCAQIDTQCQGLFKRMLELNSEANTLSLKAAS